MSYQTGAATDAIDLLQKLVAFLTANGWTSDASAADGAGAWRAHLHRGAVYANLKATVGNAIAWQSLGGPPPGASGGGLHLYLGTGYSGASNWNAQAGAPVYSTTTLGVFASTGNGALTAYHFLVNDSGDNVAVVIERTSGIFAHVGWGVNMSKVGGAWTGGAYFFGSSSSYAQGSDPTNNNNAGFAATAMCPFVLCDWSGSAVGFVRADVDTFTGKWITANYTASQSTGKLGVSGLFTSGQGTMPTAVPNMSGLENRMSTMGNQIVLFPIRFFVNRDAGGYSLVGNIPNIYRTMGTAYGVTPGTLYTLGPDTYMVYPHFAIKKT